jgi:transketolase
MHTLKPIDSEAVRVAAKETRLIVTVEEHTVHGGLGSAIAEVLAEEKNLCAPLSRFGVADDIHKMVGSQDFFLKESGLSVHDLVSAIYNNIGTR